MKQGIYIVVSETEIVKAEMESPECWMYPGPTPMECNKCLKFIDHLAALPRIPIKGKHNWKVWQEVPESEVVVQLQYLSYDENTWIPANGRTESELNYIKRPYRTVAIPIEQSKSEQDGQVFGEWQLCPKCNGQGMITGVAFTCDVCNGAKVLARPLLNNNP